ncbi:midnolin homolog isoform X1 [Rhipicephalus sanguineus]|uniref:midnolin homolog isoform X1 n=1 Tax=Rhipicephalus sanguineus TaxID=34632 RepID=UPI0020C427E1|nr:midnolin homolog isoform X1 [Rhipicephalus sanguineus]XP_049273086.1 midnolin homolog isoform X1 [Rhipicephalus sanguineus]
MPRSQELRTNTMHFAAVFGVVAFAMAVHAVPSGRTFGSSQHPEHNVHAHNHEAHQHSTVIHGQQVLVEDDSSVSVLVCQVVKVPVVQPGTRPAPTVPAAPAVGAGSPSIVGSSQEALSNLTTRVRTAVDSLVEPVVAALQNASLWLNRTSQEHLHQQHDHWAQHQHSAHNHQAHQHTAHNHHAHQHMHGSQVNQHATHEHQHQHSGHTNVHAHNHQANAAHAHQTQQAVPGQAVPMTVVSVPVMIPAVHAGSFPLVNLSAVVPAGLDVASLQFSSPVGNATSSGDSPAEPVTSATEPASTPARVNIAARTGDLPTTINTDAPVTLLSHGSSSAAVSHKFRARDVATPPPIIHIPVCPDFCCRR